MGDPLVPASLIFLSGSPVLTPLLHSAPKSRCTPDPFLYLTQCPLSNPMAIHKIIPNPYFLLNSKSNCHWTSHRHLKFHLFKMKGLGIHSVTQAPDSWPFPLFYLTNSRLNHPHSSSMQSIRTFPKPEVLQHCLKLCLNLFSTPCTPATR